MPKLDLTPMDRAVCFPSLGVTPAWGDRPIEVHRLVAVQITGANDQIQAAATAYVVAHWHTLNTIDRMMGVQPK